MSKRISRRQAREGQLRQRAGIGRSLNLKYQQNEDAEFEAFYTKMMESIARGERPANLPALRDHSDHDDSSCTISHEDLVRLGLVVPQN